MDTNEYADPGVVFLITFLNIVGLGCFKIQELSSEKSMKMLKIRPVQVTDIYKYVQFGADSNKNPDLVNLNVVS